jgi:hypothetical protein
LLDAIAASPVAAVLRDSAVIYPLVNALHIISIALLLGAIATLDLRLLGLFSRQSAAALAPALIRVAAAGLGGAVVTGALLFSTRPATYLANPAFLTKLALLGLGLINVAILRFNPAWATATDGGPIAPSVRVSALVSLAVWLGAILAGRWIGFLE